MFFLSQLSTAVGKASPAALLLRPQEWAVLSPDLELQVMAGAHSGGRVSICTQQALPLAGPLIAQCGCWRSPAFFSHTPPSLFPLFLPSYLSPSLWVEAFCLPPQSEQKREGAADNIGVGGVQASGWLAPPPQGEPAWYSLFCVLLELPWHKSSKLWIKEQRLITDGVESLKCIHPLRTKSKCHLWHHKGHSFPLCLHYLLLNVWKVWQNIFVAAGCIQSAKHAVFVLSRSRERLNHRVCLKHCSLLRILSVPAVKTGRKRRRKQREDEDKAV